MPTVYFTLMFEKPLKKKKVNAKISVMWKLLTIDNIKKKKKKKKKKKTHLV